jgi:hypothetical protein
MPLSVLSIRRILGVLKVGPLSVSELKLTA